MSYPKKHETPWIMFDRLGILVLIQTLISRDFLFESVKKKRSIHFSF